MRISIFLNKLLPATVIDATFQGNVGRISRGWNRITRLRIADVLQSNPVYAIAV
ncbi:hypothetical protein Z946_2300 [Sulfitobacter noctilucicola]|nr:hypothetical protein Z946_2300 [Sulfitobacter noctilucicola]